MHLSFKFKFGTLYIYAIESIALFFFSFSVLSGIDVSCICSSFLEECVENICCNETDYSYL